MKNNNLEITILIAIAILLISYARSIYSNTTNSNPSTVTINQQQLANNLPKVYIALETNSQETTELSQNILYWLARRKQNQWKWVAIDILIGKRVENLYSQAAKHRDLEVLGEQVKTVRSSDQALIQAIQRFKDEIEQSQQQPVYGFIVTKGTTNPSSLDVIRQICQKLAANGPLKARITMIGLSSKNRLLMSEAFAPIRGNVQFAGATEEEWKKLLSFGRPENENFKLAD
ncbi:MAG: hypothetical protein N2235_01185 [Fischerella sp.]|nr:hypothetical protein [Fischerella sp.]